MDARSELANAPDSLHGVKKARRRSRRGGKKVQIRRIAAIQRELADILAQQPALEISEPRYSAGAKPAPDVITIDDSDKETVVIPTPPPPIEIMDTDSPLQPQRYTAKSSTVIHSRLF